MPLVERHERVLSQKPPKELIETYEHFLVALMRRENLTTLKLYTPVHGNKERLVVTQSPGGASGCCEISVAILPPPKPKCPNCGVEINSKLLWGEDNEDI